MGGASTQTHARRARTWAVETHTRTPSLLVVFSVYWSLFLFQCFSRPAVWFNAQGCITAAVKTRFIRVCAAREKTLTLTLTLT